MNDYDEIEYLRNKLQEACKERDAYKNALIKIATGDVCDYSASVAIGAFEQVKYDQENQR